jgi:hypothetical protein
LDADPAVVRCRRRGLWQVWEIGAGGKGLRRVTPAISLTCTAADAVYLPNRKINFISQLRFRRSVAMPGLRSA